VTWLLLLVLQISVAMAVGFVLGRIWQFARTNLEYIAEIGVPDVQIWHIAI
jgi:hypothetical protein